MAQKCKYIRHVCRKKTMENMSVTVEGGLENDGEQLSPSLPQRIEAMPEMNTKKSMC